MIICEIPGLMTVMRGLSTSKAAELTPSVVQWDDLRPLTWQLDFCVACDLLHGESLKSIECGIIARLRDV